MTFQVGDRVKMYPGYCHPNGCGRISRIDGMWADVRWDAGMRDSPFELDHLYPETPIPRPMVRGDISTETIHPQRASPSPNDDCPWFWAAYWESPKLPAKPREKPQKFKAGNIVQFQESGPKGTVMGYDAAGYVLVRWADKRYEGRDWIHSECLLTLVKPPDKPVEPFPIGTHVRWHDQTEDPATGVVVGVAANGWPRVKWQTWLGEITDQENPEYLRLLTVSDEIVSEANDLQSNDVRPKPPQDAFSDEWGKWWWDTRHTRGRLGL